MDKYRYNETYLKKLHDIMIYYPSYREYILNQIEFNNEFLSYKELYYQISEYIFN